MTDGGTSYLPKRWPPGIRRAAMWRTWPRPLCWLRLMSAQRGASTTCAKSRHSANWNGRGRSPPRCAGTASSARIRQELGYQEPVAIEEAIRRTIPWERENPPAIGSQAQFDYAAED